MKTHKQVSSRLSKQIGEIIKKHDGFPSDPIATYCMGYLKALRDNKQLTDKTVNTLTEEFIGTIH
jgi:hypothetical protein